MESKQPAAVSYFERRFERLALTYARATGRAAVYSPDAAALSTTAGLEVILGTFEHVTAEVLCVVDDIARACGFMPGFILGEDEAQLERMCVQMLGHLVHVASPDALRCDILPELDAVGARSPTRIVLGRRAPLALLRAELRRRHNILYINTHSDGIDAQLSDGNVLCGVKSLFSAGKEPGPKPAACVCLNTCYRLGESMPDALSSPKLVSSTDIDAEFLFVDACFAIRPSDASGVVDRQWSLFSQLVIHARYRAAAFAIDLREGATADAEWLLQSIQAGDDLGTAFGAFVSSNYAVGHDICYVIVGDPRVRFESGNYRSRTQDLPDPSTASSSGPQASYLERTIYALQATQHAISELGDSSDRATLDVQSRSSEQMLDVLAGGDRGWVSVYAASFESLVYQPAVAWECYSCKSRGRLRLAHDRLGEERQITRCWACETTGDQPASIDGTIAWDVAQQRLQIQNVHKMSAARLLLFLKGETTSYRQIAIEANELTSSNGLAIEVSRLGDLSGPVTISLIYLCGSTFGLISMRHNFFKGSIPCAESH